MYPFDVILFDVGGVLLTNGWDHAERAAVVKQFWLDGAAFERKHAVIASAWERGEIGMDQYLDATVFDEPRCFSRREFFDFVLAQSQLLPDGAMPVLKELSASNRCMIGALNNEARETNEYRFGQFGLRRYLKVALSSCYLRLRKPEPAMYYTALDVLGAEPVRVLFIDDREENVAAGTAAGMTAIQFTGEQALRKELARLSAI